MTGTAPALPPLQVDAARVVMELCALAGFSDAPGDPSSDGVAVTRVVFTEADLAARAYVTELARHEGLSVRVDAVGNTFFRWEGTEPHIPAVATGSHIDAIPNAGMFDGTVGVLGALAAVRTLRLAGFTPRRSIEVILFTSEEPTRFGIGCLGSRMLAGALTPGAAGELKDGGGQTVETASLAAGFSGDLSSVRLSPGVYNAFLELHIEQGPELERAGVPIGIVSAIAAPASERLTFEGEGGHAGALLMHRRRDALVAAAEVIRAVEDAALATGSEDTVATVGMCEVFPGAVNSVPSRVRLSLDVRDVDLARRDAVRARIARACAGIADRRQVELAREILNADAPAVCDKDLLELLEAHCQSEGMRSQRMVSRAYHDALFMAQLCPAAMLFLPCRNGVSHRPDEFASAADIGDGVLVLARTIAALSLRG